VFDRIMQTADNAGGAVGHGALICLAAHHPALYARAAEADARDSSMSVAGVRPSPDVSRKL
jgi:hypothetical protein